MSPSTHFLLTSLRVSIAPFKNSIATIAPAKPFTEKEWKEIFCMAKIHGITAIVLDAVSHLPTQMQPPFAIKMQWIGMVDSIEERYRFQYNTAAKFAELMQRHNIRTLVMKGLAFSTYYPKPEHRECGDLDCFLGDRFEEGNFIATLNGARNDGGNYKHTHLNFMGLDIENHKYLTNFNATHRGKLTEKLLQHYILMPSQNIGDTYLQLPSAEFNTLFLVKHAQKHFIDEGIKLRHIFDWAVLLKEEQDNLDWNKLYSVMKECRTFHFANALTEICQKYIGIQISNKNINTTAHNSLAKIILDDILSQQSYSIHNETFCNKILRILKRFSRMWRFRKIADECFLTLVWNTFAFSSYLKRKPKL